MCGGAQREPDREEAPAPAVSDPSYTPPALSSLYQAFRETGKVPYSYYGVNAPTREGEVEAMRKSYPGAFSAPSSSAPAQPTQPEPRRDPMARLLSRMGPLGAILGGIASLDKNR